jgi:hypothetical protein
MDRPQEGPVDSVSEEFVLFKPSVTLFDCLPRHVTEGASIHCSCFFARHLFYRSQLKLARCSKLNDVLGISTNRRNENSIVFFAELFQFNCKRNNFSNHDHLTQIFISTHSFLHQLSFSLAGMCILYQHILL